MPEIFLKLVLVVDIKKKGNKQIYIDMYIFNELMLYAPNYINIIDPVR